MKTPFMALATSKFKIAVPNPCHQVWDNMDFSQNGRYCHHCEKEVIDFTKLSTEELKDWFSASNTKVCGRIAPEQLIAINNQQPPKFKLGTTSTRILVAACFTIVANLKTNASNLYKPIHSIEFRKNAIDKKLVKEEDLTTTDSLITITGNVKDSKDGLPLSGASIKLKGLNLTTTTDEKGRFILKVPAENEKITIMFNYIGYLALQKEIKLSKANIDVYMEADQAVMGEVIIVSHRSSNLFLNIYQKVKAVIR